MGFTDIFKRSKPQPTAPAPTQAEINEATADFIEVESYSGGTFHVVANLEHNGLRFGKPTLCGYDNWLRTSSSSPIDGQKASMDTTGHNWNYCPKCRDALLAIEAGRAEAGQFPNTSLLDFRIRP